ncbi:MAG TPA: acyl-CoA dehydrogenase family protein [candidate division Zixibacteria bacterium]|nr:acyl-CoA dehydrogenase family protein [candidate division Zixibacteria bacterium]
MGRTRGCACGTVDFYLSEEEEGLRRAVEAFVREELSPLEPEFENAPDIFEGSRWKSRARRSEDPEIRRFTALMEELEKKAEARGLWHLDVPKQYGGLEASNVAMLAVTEELEKSSIPFELGNHVSNILYACRGEQIERFLLPCIRGEKTSAFALSEPASGSDPSMLRTTAAPDGDYFVINGTKMFPTFADVADFVQLFARLPGTEGRDGVTCFLIETGTPGYRVVRSIATIAGTEPCELVFENCRVHRSQVLGEVGKGWELNQAWLGARRFQVGIRSHGTAQRVLRVLKAEGIVPENRGSFAERIGGFLGELAALRSLTYYGAWKADRKLDARGEAAAVKLFATELLHRVIDFALEAAGPSALRKRHVLARAFRHARSRRIVEGPSEIQRHILQRILFREGAASVEIG